MDGESGPAIYEEEGEMGRQALTFASVSLGFRFVFSAADSSSNGSSSFSLKLLAAISNSVSGRSSSSATLPSSSRRVSFNPTHPPRRVPHLAATPSSQHHHHFLTRRGARS